MIGALLTLVLVPWLAEETELRGVVWGTPDATWEVDGEVVATGTQVQFALPAGHHAVFVHGDGEDWGAMLRPDAARPGEVAVVPAWSETVVSAPSRASWGGPLLFLGAGLVMATMPWWPRRGLLGRILGREREHRSVGLVAVPGLCPPAGPVRDRSVRP